MLIKMVFCQVNIVGTLKKSGPLVMSKLNFCTTPVCFPHQNKAFFDKERKENVLLYINIYFIVILIHVVFVTYIVPFLYNV